MFSAIALMVALVVLPGCNTVSDEEEIGANQTNVTTDDLTGDLGTEGTGIKDAESLVGQEVTVRSMVQAAVGDTGFTLATDSGEPILVINATTGTFVTPDQSVPVQVTGKVARFVRTDVETNYNLTLDEIVYGDYEDRPVIIAESLALAPTAEDLAENPDAFDDQVIAVYGDVRNILSDGTFTLFDEGWVDDYGILVVGVDRDLKANDAALQEGEAVVVTGRTQPFDAETLQKDYNLNLTPEQISEFNERYNRPVLVAEDIYPSAVDK
ncbi:MAG: hypothetical protein DCF21_04135 [Leptolyngbya sp.]|nr:MAG: hypothetical protein DCF21_04135 [Leptolyngbya sp.]